jgi:hypothetical protein
MTMAGFPVVIVAKGGLPVTEITNGVALTVAANGFGTPVQIVAKGGIPVTFTGAAEAPAGGLTWNPDDKEAAILLTNSNRTATNSGAPHNAAVRAQSNVTSGKWHWEITVGTPWEGNGAAAGIATDEMALTNYLGDQADSLGWYNDGALYLNELIIATVAGYAAGNRLAIEFDATAKLIWFAVGSGNWNNSPTANPATGAEGISTAGIVNGTTISPASSLYGTTDSTILHTEAASFTRAVSSGFAAYATASGGAPPSEDLVWDVSRQGQSTLNLTGYTLAFDDPMTDAGRLYSEQYSIAGEGGNYIAPVGSWFAPVHAQGNGAAAHLDPDPVFRDPAKPNPFSYTTNPGALTITMEQVGGAWQSGSMQTADWRNQGYLLNKGYFEMRAKFENKTGTWFAFWLISQVYTTGGSISERIEYDIVEAYGGDPGHHNTIHINTTGKDPVHVGDYTGTVGLGGNMFDGQYHTYGALITATHLITYWDGKELARMDITGRDEFERAQFHIIVTLAGDPDYIAGATGQNRMIVDYVKVWTI